jgi:inward rectifier potassium channel
MYHRALTVPWPRFVGLMGAGFALVNAIFAALYLLGGDCFNATDPDSALLAFSFSVQTISGIGYGAMAPTTAWAHVVSDLEAFIGLTGIAVWTGLIFARFSRPTARVRFSKNALVRNRDGKPYLMFRMANERGNQIVEAQISVVALVDTVTAEGDSLRRLHALKLDRDRTPVFSLTWTAFHPLDEDSPIHGLVDGPSEDVFAGIVCNLTGLDETLVQTVHAQAYFNVEDVLWGKRFLDMIEPGEDGILTVHHDRLDLVEPG